MPGEHQPNAELREGPQGSIGIVDAPLRLLQLPFRPQERMVNNDDADAIGGSPVEPSRQRLQLVEADQPLCPVETAAYAPDRSYPGNCHALHLDKRLKLGADEAPIVAVGMEEPLNQVPLRHVM